MDAWRLLKPASATDRRPGLLESRLSVINALHYHATTSGTPSKSMRKYHLFEFVLFLSKGGRTPSIEV